MLNSERAPRIIKPCTVYGDRGIAIGVTRVAAEVAGVRGRREGVCECVPSGSAECRVARVGVAPSRRTCGVDLHPQETHVLTI